MLGVFRGCLRPGQILNLLRLATIVVFVFQLFAWGYNGNGQLGVGNNANQLTPCKVIGLVGTITTQVRTSLKIFVQGKMKWKKFIHAK